MTVLELADGKPVHGAARGAARQRRRYAQGATALATLPAPCLWVCHVCVGIAMLAAFESGKVCSVSTIIIRSGASFRCDVFIQALALAMHYICAAGELTYCC